MLHLEPQIPPIPEKLSQSREIEDRCKGGQYALQSEGT